jgi:hypothetical protein
MLIAFKPLHTLLCDEVLLYFILRIGIVQKFKFEFESKEFEFLKDMNKGKTISYFPFGHGPKPSSRGLASLPLSPIWLPPGPANR